MNTSLGAVTAYEYGSTTVSITEWSSIDFTLGKPSKGTYLVIPKVSVVASGMALYDINLFLGAASICRDYNLAGTAKMPSGIFTTDGKQNLILRVFSKTTVQNVSLNGTYNIIKIH